MPGGLSKESDALMIKWKASQDRISGSHSAELHQQCGKTCFTSKHVDKMHTILFTVPWKTVQAWELGAVGGLYVQVSSRCALLTFRLVC